MGRKLGEANMISLRHADIEMLEGDLHGHRYQVIG